MSAKDLKLSLAASIVTALFLTPTLLNTNLFNLLPYGYLFLYVGFPLVSIAGMYVAYILGKKIPILWQIAKFGFVGVLNTAIDFGILNALISLTGIKSGTEIIALNAISFSIAVINSYFWNKQWVFTSGKKNKFVNFLVVTLIGLFINSGVIYLLTTFTNPIIVNDPTQWANLAKVIATCLSLIWNFLGYRLVVFKK